MAYTLEQFSKDVHDALSKNPGPAGREIARQCVSRACLDDEFVAKHLGPDNKNDRTILYEDPELKFCILAHVYEGRKESQPHDHGPAWAIYGQVEGVTEMTDWECLERPKDGQPGKVRKIKSYEMKRGDAYVYNEGFLHSPRRENTTRLIRMEGVNMKGLTRDKYVVAEEATA